MKNICKSSLVGPIIALILITGVELFFIFNYNKGIFTFTLDDPYIHLEVARNILKGTYGVNTGEISSPVSSIIWPFLLLPVARNYTASHIYILTINFIFSLAFLYFLCKILSFIFLEINDDSSLSKEDIEGIISLILWLSIVAFNIIPLIFSGMEHSLQILLVSIIFYGVLIYLKKSSWPRWLTLILIISPLVRYELAGIVFPLLFFVFLPLKGKKYFFTVSFIIIFLLSSFSLYLYFHGLPLLPQSVLVKVTDSFRFTKFTDSFYYIVYKLHKTLTNLRGLVLIALLLFFLFLVYFYPEKNKKVFLFFKAIFYSVVLHIFFGDYGWSYRYEIYIYLYVALGIILAALPFLVRVIKNGLNWRVKFYFHFAVYSLCYPYLVYLFLLPLACNNIYEQQYQMKRFVQQFYRKNVAVNDIGLVSYQNNNYVLDLYGLSNYRAWKFRKKHQKNKINSLLKKYNIKLLIIYDKWLGWAVPPGWKKFLELKIEKVLLTPAFPNVSFYINGKDEYLKLVPKLKKFLRDLPSDMEIKLFNLFSNR